VVEDDVDILRLITYNLETSGFDVATAQDGYEALALARRRVPDLIILDLMLRGSTGLKCARNSSAVTPPARFRSSCSRLALRKWIGSSGSNSGR